MIKKILFILILAGFGNLFAQSIYFSNSHTETGEPIDAKNIWGIKPWGSLIYILFDNEGKEIETSLNYIFVDRYVDGNYKPFDSKAVNVKPGATWFAYNHKFTEPGKFRVYIINQNQKELASETVTIQVESSYINNRQGTNSLYYDGVKVQFCERVIAGKVINSFRTMSMSKYDSVTVYIEHREALESSRLVVDIWEKPTGAVDYDKFVESKKYRTNPSWDYVFFHYKFDNPGNYKFNVYNENEILITAGYLRVRE